MNKATLKDISIYIDKSYNTVKGWTTRQPKLKEICLLGMTCKKNNIDLSKLLQLIKTSETFNNDKKS